MNAEIPCHHSAFLCLESRAFGLSLDQHSSCLQAILVPRLALAWHAPLKSGLQHAMCRLRWMQRGVADWADPVDGDEHS
jgi:hypothetical protein